MNSLVMEIGLSSVKSPYLVWQYPCQKWEILTAFGPLSRRGFVYVMTLRWNLH
jgi:hypothetical protein